MCDVGAYVYSSAGVGGGGGAGDPLLTTGLLLTVLVLPVLFVGAAFVLAYCGSGADSKCVHMSE